VFFEEFAVDAAFVTGGRTITEADIVSFAALTGDHSGIHVNDEVAKASAAGARIAHGALVFSISLGLTTQLAIVDESLIALHGVEGMRFTKPVFIGDTIHVQKRVTAAESRGHGRGVVTFDTRVLNQHDAMVLRYRDSLVLKARD
jgi:acyl dehydratase